TRYLTEGETRERDALPVDDEVARELLTTLVHCNDATFSSTDSTGDPTEIALLEAGSRFGVYQRDLIREQPRLAEKPFDSVRKMMSTVGRSGTGSETADAVARVYTKGALDSILPLCTSVATGSATRAITDEDRRRIAEASAAMSDEALRVLAAATRVISAEGIVIDDLEKELTFVGLVGMMDPPRLEVRDSIAQCRRAGITPVMITGDHQNTAFAIAKELGIAAEKSQAISGSEIDLLTDEELELSAEHLRVFARVSPEHKVRIVRAFKNRGHIVSMTGDGVNDAPSLKAADIGVAMGITGTDVAKGASDIVLTDDNFKTIVSAVAAGRNIYANIKKAITFLLSCNAGEIIAIFTAILVGWRSPLLPIHILWINLITDSLPALGLGMDPGDPSVLDRPPRPPRESLFAGGTGLSVLLTGPLIGAITLVAYRLGLHLSGDSLVYARTMAFVALALSQLFHAFDVRDNRRSIFSLGLFTNKWLWLALGAGALLQWIVVSVPGLAGVFRVVPLSGRDWGIVLGLSFAPVVLNELVKFVMRATMAAHGNRNI
ncbi:MAG: cation-translocating P-type ATPase, partial [Spirochaetia bacterium]